MGNFNISIQGLGFHPNTNLPKDVNRMAKTFAGQLKAEGHIITSASITTGGADDLQTADYSFYETVPPAVTNPK